MKKNPFDIQAEIDEQAERDAKLKREREQYSRDLAELMRTRAGRHVVNAWIHRYGRDGDPFDTNAMMMARRSGIRFVALEISQEIKAALPAEFATMEAENG